MRPSDGEAGRIARQIGMALAGQCHIERACQPDADRTMGLPRAERGDRREGVRLHLFAAEGSAHTQAGHRTRCLATPSARATISCVSVGCCVDEWTDTPPLSSSHARAACVSR